LEYIYLQMFQIFAIAKLENKSDLFGYSKMRQVVEISKIFHILYIKATVCLFVCPGSA
jgi:hypothetical protein